MTVTPIEFGKTLRPTTVELVNKLNEMITAVNALNPDVVTQLSQDVNTLKTTASDLSSKVTKNTGDIATLKQTQESHTEDIDKMKVTLYTPLKSTDTDPSGY
jgi:hypothetical protein